MKSILTHARMDTKGGTHARMGSTHARMGEEKSPRARMGEAGRDRARMGRVRELPCANGRVCRVSVRTWVRVEISNLDNPFVHAPMHAWAACFLRCVVPGSR